ncbi:hypothetical protein [Neptunomonas japonica]|uniref:hypothetical protein n=1 Tax=Neptunomonas japonica TaxID=417574 RepID=UPI00040F793F|nr:hypothetical protein [Neptunomonas japonica]
MSKIVKYLAMISLISISKIALAALVTFDFSGQMLPSAFGSNWNVGDQISGYYQFETDSAYRIYDGFHQYDEGDFSIKSFYINVGGDEYFGNEGYIAIQNDTYLGWSSSYHDRYIATLFTTGAPDVSYFQIDLASRNSSGPVDLVDSTNLVPYVPNYLLVNDSGRFVLSDGQQPRLVISNMEATTIPLPSTLLLFLSGLLSVFFTKCVRLPNTYEPSQVNWPK